MMSNEEFDRLVHAYLDDELPAPVRNRFEAAVAADPALALRLKRRRALDSAFRRAVFQEGSVLDASGRAARGGFRMPRVAPWVASGLVAAAAAFALPGLMLLRTGSVARVAGEPTATPVVFTAESRQAPVPMPSAVAVQRSRESGRVSSHFHLASLREASPVLESPVSIAEIDLDGMGSIPAAEIVRALLVEESSARRPGRYARVDAQLLAPDPAEALLSPATVIPSGRTGTMYGSEGSRFGGYDVQFSSFRYGR